MSKANSMARANAKANILALAGTLSLQQSDHGRDTHNAADCFQNLFLLQLGACYNDTQPGECMLKLINAGNNLLTVIKSTNLVTADSVCPQGIQA